MTLYGIMAVILRYFSEFAYLPGVMRKSSRSLSHLLMSFCRFSHQNCPFMCGDLDTLTDGTLRAWTSSGLVILVFYLLTLKVYGNFRLLWSDEVPRVETRRPILFLSQAVLFQL